MASLTTPQKPVSFSLIAMNRSMALLLSTFALVCFVMRSTFTYVWNSLARHKSEAVAKPEAVTNLHADWIAQTNNDLNNLATRSLIETQNRHSEMAQLRTRTETEMDTLREEITQMRTEMITLKSSIIILRRAL